jgi:hypothetical protein
MHRFALPEPHHTLGYDLWPYFFKNIVKLVIVLSTCALARFCTWSMQHPTCLDSSVATDTATDKFSTTDRMFFTCYKDIRLRVIDLWFVKMGENLEFSSNRIKQ